MEDDHKQAAFEAALRLADVLMRFPGESANDDELRNAVRSGLGDGGFRYAATGADADELSRLVDELLQLRSRLMA